MKKRGQVHKKNPCVHMDKRIFYHQILWQSHAFKTIVHEICKNILMPETENLIIKQFENLKWEC